MTEMITISKEEYEMFLSFKQMAKKLVDFSENQKEIKDEIIEEIKAMSEKDFLSEEESQEAFLNLLKNSEV